MSALSRPHFAPPPARSIEGRTPKEKHPFLFQKKFHPRQIRNARSVFSFGVSAEALRGGGGAIHSRSKKVRANAKITPRVEKYSNFNWGIFLARTLSKQTVLLTSGREKS